MRTLAVVLALLPALASAQTVTLSHSGYLLDATDAAVTTPALPMRFRILDAATTGAELWTSGASACAIAVRAGYYETRLGSTCGPAIAESVLAPGLTRWLETIVDGVALTPRSELTALPSASRAALAEDATHFDGHTPAWWLDASHLTGTIGAGVLPLATTASPGALSASDKAKLDGIGAGAQLVGLSGTGPITVGSGTSPVISITPATTSAAGSLSAADKAKLDGLGAGAQLVGLDVTAPLATTGGTSPMLSIGLATPSSAGAMSAADKAKLDGLGGVQGTGSAVPVRQTVLTGAVNGVGAAAFLSAGTGLSVNLAATATPITLAFADGYDSNGARDFLGTVSSDVTGAWTLPANATSFLYVDRNTSTGMLSYGSTTSVPSYGTALTLGGNLVPTMTSATTPSGVASASANYDTTWTAFRAFDKVTGANGWCSANGSTSGWLRYQFPSSQFVPSYRVTARSDCAACTPKAWTFEGSADGSSWTVLDTRTNEAGWAAGQQRSYTTTTSTAYAYYRLNVTQNDGHPTVVCVTELDLVAGPENHFELNSFRMRTRAAGTWANVQRVFVGEATTGASSVTSVTTYALRGYYRGDVGTVGLSSTWYVNHNLGLPVANLDVNVWAEDPSTGAVIPVRGTAIVDYTYSQNVYELVASIGERNAWGIRFPSAYVLVYTDLGGTNRTTSSGVKVTADVKRRW